MLQRNIFRDNAHISYSEFMDALEAGNISSVTVIEDRFITGKMNDTNQYFETEITPSNELWALLRKKKVAITFKSQKASGSSWGWWVLLLILGALFFYLISQQQHMGDPRMFFSESKAKYYPPGTVKNKFDTVAGLENAKEDLEDIIQYLKDPERFKRMGAKMPNGILFTGNPGTGKTLLAKAMAGEANCSFFSISGSDFMELYVGVGAGRVRALFEQARKHAPSIIFIDEIDAIGRQRSGGNFSGAHQELEYTLNQMLVEMDGFSTQKGTVVVIGATNRPDVLDKALTRPGRFDRTVDFPLPDVKTRFDILKVHAKNVSISPKVDFEIVARSTPGFSGAELENLVNEAVIRAIRQNKNFADIDDFEHARDKITMGAEKKTLLMTDDDKLMTAYHEAGHTLLTVFLNNTDPLHKVTILPRGHALGVSYSIPERDEVHRSKNKMLDFMKMALGGYLAEDMIYGDVTSGASNDLQKVTATARRMVYQYGMSQLGTQVFDDPSIPNSQDRQLSEDTKRALDKEMQRIIDQCFTEAKDLLSRKRKELDLLAKELFKRETLDSKEVYELLGLEQKVSHSFK